jgi:uncharacterized protein (DUF2384 family)
LRLALGLLPLCVLVLRLVLRLAVRAVVLRVGLGVMAIRLTALRVLDLLVLVARRGRGRGLRITAVGSRVVHRRRMVVLRDGRDRGQRLALCVVLAVLVL